MEYAQVKGFNYQPSYGSSGFELWRKFDAKIVAEELGRGTRYFPSMNAIRVWLSWDAFIREPPQFAAHFERLLEIADTYQLRVMPVLFNRWHIPDLDYGGIYIDHFLPTVSWVQKDRMFEPYLDAIVGEHAHDDRVFAWDLCNEPFSYSCAASDIPDITEAENRWLTGLYEACKRLRAVAPVTIGTHPNDGRAGLERVEPISDILSIHPYYIPSRHSKQAYEQLLDDYVAVASTAQKPLLGTETCWGALDDDDRVSIIQYTLGELAKRRIGWLVYLLHHSLIADAHRPAFGPVGEPGNLAFIEADGSLRPGHEVFNHF